MERFSSSPWALPLYCSVLPLLVTGTAQGERPDEPGALFRYDSADVLAYYDVPEGNLRVHFSQEGPNQTLLEDVDSNGVPDFVEVVGEKADEALAFYGDLGFRPPLLEEDVGLDPLGGSPALDIYLVDFGGSADGYFSIDDCLGLRCSGHVVMENDFAGYRYESPEEGISILTSHELFHGVQFAYTWDQEIWVSEGTAVWAEEAIGWGHDDFIAFSDAYLEEAWRPLDRPPSGPVPAFAYGTGIFWDFLSRRHGESIIPALQEAVVETPDAIEALGDLIDERSDTWEALWLDFAQANLSTGERSGVLDGHPYARELDGILPEFQASTVDDELRLWGIGAQYIELEHPGGPLSLAMGGETSGVHLIAYPTENGAVLPAIAWLEGVEGALEVREDLGDTPPGTHWLLLTLPVPGDSSQTIHVCAGDLEADAICGAPTPEPTSPTPSPSPTGTPEGGGPLDPGGCGCEENGASLGAIIALGLWGRRRRKAWI